MKEKLKNEDHFIVILIIQQIVCLLVCLSVDLFQYFSGYFESM